MPARNQGVARVRGDTNRRSPNRGLAGDRWLIGVGDSPMAWVAGPAFSGRISHDAGISVLARRRRRRSRRARPHTNRYPRNTNRQQNGHTCARKTASIAVPPNTPLQTRLRLQQRHEGDPPQRPCRAPNPSWRGQHSPDQVMRQQPHRLSGIPGGSPSFRAPCRSGTSGFHTRCRPARSGSTGRASSSRSPGRGCRTPARNWSCSR